MLRISEKWVLVPKGNTTQLLLRLKNIAEERWKEYKSQKTQNATFRQDIVIAIRNS